MQRRRFFRSAVGEAAAFFDELRGIPQLRLSDLASLDWNALRSLVPVITPNTRIEPGDPVIQACVVEREEPIPLFAAGSLEASIFNGFNGLSSLEEIASDLVERYGLEYEDAVPKVRSLFLHLVGKGICVPSNHGQA